jgi:hypothetical protein
MKLEEISRTACWSLPLYSHVVAFRVIFNLDASSQMSTQGDFHTAIGILIGYEFSKIRYLLPFCLNAAIPDTYPEITQEFRCASESVHRHAVPQSVLQSSTEIISLLDITPGLSSRAPHQLWAPC